MVGESWDELGSGLNSDLLGLGFRVLYLVVQIFGVWKSWCDTMTRPINQPDTARLCWSYMLAARLAAVAGRCGLTFQHKPWARRIAAYYSDAACAAQTFEAASAVADILDSPQLQASKYPVQSREIGAEGSTEGASRRCSQFVCKSNLPLSRCPSS